jgi:hypothetical protein
VPLHQASPRPPPADILPGPVAAAAAAPPYPLRPTAARPRLCGACSSHGACNGMAPAKDWRLRQTSLSRLSHLDDPVTAPASAPVAAALCRACRACACPRLRRYQRHSADCTCHCARHPQRHQQRALIRRHRIKRRQPQQTLIETRPRLIPVPRQWSLAPAVLSPFIEYRSPVPDAPAAPAPAPAESDDDDAVTSSVACGAATSNTTLPASASSESVFTAGEQLLRARRRVGVWVVR